jgi:Ca-activated chloride channel family protein
VEDHEGNTIEMAASAAEEGVQINIIGIGSPGGAPIPSVELGVQFMTDNEGNVVVSRLNEQMGIEIAQSGHGMYARADNSNSAVQALVAQLDELETTTTSSLSYSEYDEKFIVFAWILLVIIFIEILIYEKKNPIFRNIRIFSKD